MYIRCRHHRFNIIIIVLPLNEDAKKGRSGLEFAQIALCVFYVDTGNDLVVAGQVHDVGGLNAGAPMAVFFQRVTRQKMLQEVHLVHPCIGRDSKCVAIVEVMFPADSDAA